MPQIPPNPVKPVKTPIPDKPLHPAPSVIGSAGKLLSGFSYSIWRSMRGKPHFMHIADSNFFWHTNMAAVFATGVSFYLFEQNFEIAIMFSGIRTLLFVALTYYFLSGEKRTRVGAACCLGGIAGYDALECLVLLGFQMAEQSDGLAVETVPFVFGLMQAISFRSIKRCLEIMPPQVQKRGYKPDQLSFKNHTPHTPNTPLENRDE